MFELSPDAIPSKEFNVARNHLAEHLSERRTLFLFEGGIVYSGSYEGAPCLVVDEGTLQDFSPELGAIEPRVRIFTGVRHREAYIAACGWSEMRLKWRHGELRDLYRGVEQAYERGGLESGERDHLLSRIDAFTESFPVGGLEVGERGLLPEHFAFRTSNAFAGASATVWDGEALTETRDWAPSPPDFQPTARQWRSFWRGIAGIGAWDWSGKADPADGTLLDAGTWRFDLAHRGRKISIHGAAGADEHSCQAQLERLFERLFDGWKR